ncbi:MAG: prepilin-type N-terminal cleavage/methylation domain-containing protein [Lentisphaeria bacterium]|nr:prepilin-type N-terminal cleavage/methylation domain-containing protein [Lentisphaeria bacterium]
MKRHRGRFTLIELLTVVALISMLMAVGVPAFARMIRGSKVDESARNIKLALEQAQMRAASERCYVAVIFPYGSVSDSLKPYLLGGFRTAYVRKNGSNYDFIRWVEGSDWSNAHNGAALVKVATSSSSVSPTNGYVAGCTTSTGVLEGSGDLRQVSGVKDDKGVTLDFSGGARGIVFNPYGGAEGNSKLYLLVSEALIEGMAVSYPTASSAGSNTTANYRVLKVNNLTGRVEFEQ